MKKMIALLLAMVMILGLLAGCGKKSNKSNKKTSSGTGKTTASENSDSALMRIQKAGKLVVATSPDFPPFESLEGGQVVGIEVDIMQKVCEKLGVELELVQADYDSVLKDVQTGKYDCAASGIAVTEDKKQKMLFSDPFFALCTVIVVKADSAIAGKAELTGKIVSVQTGTIAESDCQDAGITTRGFYANADAKAALTTGKADAWVVDNLTALQMVQAGDGLKILEEKITEVPYAFAFPFGSEELIAEINGTLNTMIEDGTMEQIFAKYGEPYVKP